MTIINIIAKILIETYDKIMGDFFLKDTSSFFFSDGECRLFNVEIITA